MQSLAKRFLRAKRHRWQTNPRARFLVLLATLTAAFVVIGDFRYSVLAVAVWFLVWLLGPDFGPFRRWLAVDIIGPAPPLRVLARSHNLPELAVMQGCLDSYGIGSCILDEHIGSLFLYYAFAVREAKLAVRDSDFDAATQCLQEARFESAFQGDLLRCPRCASAELLFQPFFTLPVLLFVPLHIFLPIPKKRWKCLNCRHSFPPPPEPA